MPKKKVILEIRRSAASTYLVLSTVNCLSPEAGSVISKHDAECLIESKYEVVIKNPRRV
jgi:hypothetical protein